MCTVACVLKTPAAANAPFPDIAPTRIDLRVVGANRPRFMFEVAYREPIAQQDQDGSAVAIFQLEGKFYRQTDADSALRPIAHGQYLNGNYTFTLDRELAELAEGVESAHALAQSILEEMVLMSPDSALCPIDDIPYLLISHKMHSIVGKPYHELMLTLEDDSTVLSVEGRQVARWGVWQMKEAVAEINSLAQQLERDMNEAINGVPGELATFVLVDHVSTEIEPEDMPALVAAFDRLPALPRITNPQSAA